MKKENVIVEAIYDAKEGNNPNFKTLQLRTTWVEKNFLNDLLGSDGFERSKVAFQSVHKDVIAAKGIKVGTNLGAVMGADLRIIHTESLSDGPGFQALMLIGKDGKPTDTPITSGGAQIYFKRELGDANKADTKLQRDVAAVSEAVAIESEEETA
jgi:hypothetical protein